jgi:glycosyltransferase involved in cell wall biosynthesis
LRAVKSALEQTHDRIEIIVVDDGSNEADYLKLEKELNAFHVKLLRISHSGHPGVVRNAGIENCKGDWIAFLDSDDFWHPNKVKTQLLLASEFDLDVVSCNMSESILPNFPKETQEKVIEVELNSLLKSNWITNSSVMASKKILSQVGNIVEAPNCVGVEDYATWLRLCTLGTWKHLNENLGFYERASEDSIRGRDNYNRFAHHFAIADFLNWMYVKNISNLFASRFLLKFLRYLISFDMIVSRPRNSKNIK